MNNTSYVLAHHGIKGMKWGVRRTPQQLGRRLKNSKQKETAYRNKLTAISKNRNISASDRKRIEYRNQKFGKRVGKTATTGIASMLIINPDKLKITSSTMITKDVMKDAKKYVRSLEKLKVNELIK